MSRYLSRLVRDTRSKLSPPSGLRLPPRAPAAYEEVHEERLVTTPSFGQSAKPLSEIPAVRANAEQPIAPPRAPIAAPASTTPFAKESGSPVQFLPAPRAVEDLAQFQEQHVNLSSLETRAARSTNLPVRTIVPSAIEPPRERREEPALLFPETSHPWAARRPEPWREVDEEMPSAAIQAKPSFLQDESAKERPRNFQLAVSAPRQRPDPEQPAHSPIAEVPRMPAAATQPVIDVTIGKIEVTIEADSRPALRAIRPIEPRGAATRKPVPPARAAQLARQYLDR